MPEDLNSRFDQSIICHASHIDIIDISMSHSHAVFTI